MTHPGNHATGAVEMGHKDPPLSTDPLYPTASRGTGTAIISRWISCVHTAFRPHRFISGVFHKGGFCLYQVASTGFMLLVTGK